MLFMKVNDRGSYLGGQSMAVLTDCSWFPLLRPEKYRRCTLNYVITTFFDVHVIYIVVNSCNKTN